MIETCFKPKKIRHPSTDNEFFVGDTTSEISDFWRHTWPSFCLDSITELDIDLLGSSGLADKLPPNLEKLKVPVLFLSVQDRKGIENSPKRCKARASNLKSSTGKTT